MGAIMINLYDCIALCGLSEEEVLAIAEHEHIPEIAAAALGACLIDKQGGPEQIRDMIVDDIQAAFQSKNHGHARELLMALQHFLETHPQIARR